jgi:hypothetical protein
MYSTLKNMVCCRFQKWFDVDVLDFKMSYGVDFWHFYLGNCFGYFSKYWANFFFDSSSHTAEELCRVSWHQCDQKIE